MSYTSTKYRVKKYKYLPGAMPAVGTWSLITTPNSNSFYGVCWSPELGLFCAVAPSGAPSTRIITSPDGVIWTSRKDPVDNAWYAVCWKLYGQALFFQRTS